MTNIQQVVIRYLIDHPEFLTVVARWNYEEWGYLYGTSSPDGFLAGLRTVLGKDQIPMTFVALLNNVPVGSVSLVVHENEERKYLSLWLSNVFVVPERRNQGIGTALAIRVVEECKVLEVPVLYLETLKEQEAFYRRLGWEVMEQAIYRGQNVVIMAKDTEALVASKD
jgi:GNAT superfamily N-acetyltransferase